MSKSNPKAVAQIEEMLQTLQQDSDRFSEFEVNFINDQKARIGEYGDSTFFTDKQAALIERIHAERVRGEKVVKPKGK